MSIKSNQFAQIIFSFESLYNAHICFHDYQNKFKDLLPHKYFSHNTAICSSIKDTDVLICKKFDTDLCKSKAQKTEHGFWKICHVGLMELYIPLIHPEKKIQSAAMFIGQFKATPQEKNMLKSELKSELYSDSNAISQLLSLNQQKMNTMFESAKVLKYFIERFVLINSTNNDLTFDRKESMYHYLNENLDKAISLKDLATFLNLSYTRAGQIVKESFGITFPELLMNIRLERAAEILLVSNWSMSKIASVTGFRDPEYFHKSFKKKFDISPGKYKKNNLTTLNTRPENV